MPTTCIKKNVSICNPKKGRSALGGSEASALQPGSRGCAPPGAGQKAPAMTKTRRCPLSTALESRVALPREALVRPDSFGKYLTRRQAPKHPAARARPTPATRTKRPARHRPPAQPRLPVLTCAPLLPLGQQRSCPLGNNANPATSRAATAAAAGPPGAGSGAPPWGGTSRGRAGLQGGGRAGLRGAAVRLFEKGAVARLGENKTQQN